jgi:archaellum component FlaC
MQTYSSAFFFSFVAERPRSKNPYSSYRARERHAPIGRSQQQTNRGRREERRPRDAYENAPGHTSNNENENNEDQSRRWHAKCLKVLDDDLVQVNERGAAQKKELDGRLHELQSKTREVEVWKGATEEVVGELRAEVKYLRTEIAQLRNERTHVAQARSTTNGVRDVDISAFLGSPEAHMHIKTIIKDQLDRHFHDVLHSQSLPAAEERLRREMSARFEAQDIRLRSHDGLSESISARMQTVEHQTQHLSNMSHQLQIQATVASASKTAAATSSEGDIQQQMAALSKSVETISQEMARFEKSQSHLASHPHPSSHQLQDLEEQVQELKRSQSQPSGSRTCTAPVPAYGASALLMREEFARMVDTKLKSVVEQTMRCAGGGNSVDRKVDQIMRDIHDIRHQHRSTFATVQGRFAALDIQINKSRGFSMQQDTSPQVRATPNSPLKMNSSGMMTSPMGLHLRPMTAGSPRASLSTTNGLSAAVEGLENQLQAQERLLDNVHKDCEGKVKSLGQEVPSPYYLSNCSMPIF